MHLSGAWPPQRGRQRKAIPMSSLLVFSQQVGGSTLPISSTLKHRNPSRTSPHRPCETHMLTAARQLPRPVPTIPQPPAHIAHFHTYLPSRSRLTRHHSPPRPDAAATRSSQHACQPSCGRCGPRADVSVSAGRRAGTYRARVVSQHLGPCGQATTHDNVEGHSPRGRWHHWQWLINRVE